MAVIAGGAVVTVALWWPSIQGQYSQPSPTEARLARLRVAEAGEACVMIAALRGGVSSRRDHMPDGLSKRFARPPRAWVPVV